MLGIVRRNRDNDSAQAPLRSLHQEMDRLFRGFFEEEGALAGFSWPVVDLTETPESYQLRAELPGIDAKDIDIQVSGDVLTLSGEKKEESKGENANVHFTERKFGQWRRSFRLPTTADTARVEAKTANGVLELTIPKRAEARPQTIKVKPS